MYFVYILECKDTTLYTGITTDVTRRFVEHQKGVGAHYTRVHGALCMRYIEECADRSCASKREAAIKKLTIAKKLALCAQSANKKAV